MSLLYPDILPYQHGGVEKVLVLATSERASSGC